MLPKKTEATAKSLRAIVWIDMHVDFGGIDIGIG